MIRKRKDDKYIILVFLFILLVIGIGYAYLTSNLSITGATSVAGNTWDIHFDNLNITNGSVTASTPATINPSDNTKISYTVLLNRPGDYYEFTVDMVNSGTLPGKITLVELSGITTDVEDVIDYSVVYTNSTKPVAVDDILNASSSKNIKVRVYYKEDIDEGDLLTSNVDLNITVNITFNQSDEEEINTDTIVQQLKTENASCFTKYNGQVTDQVGQTVTAQNVYVDHCMDKRNIIFNNMCWQMIRTTETGGIKMVYNGDAVDGKCESTRGDHKGIIQSNRYNQDLSSSYLYGSSFTYDITNNTFTLTDTETATWSDSTYENLLGKFTCKTSSDTCTTIYNVNGYKSNTEGYSSAYTIGDTNYAQIGTSSFNAYKESPAMVGYMFNKVYNSKTKNPGTTEYKFGSGFTYDTSTNTYTLSGTTQNISDWSTGYNQLNNTHYTCWNEEGTCNTISYIYFTSSPLTYYVEIRNGKSITDVLNEMLFEDSVNKYNSSIKGIIDSWYAQNLSSKTNMLEDTVYCNGRNITYYGGWNPDGGSTTAQLGYKNYGYSRDLSCLNETDQFAVGNNKAKLTYPVSLINEEDLFNLGVLSLTRTGAAYMELSAHSFYNQSAFLGYVRDDGTFDYDNGSFGTRPAISLKNGAIVFGGTGSETDPWIIE